MMQAAISRNGGEPTRSAPPSTSAAMPDLREHGRFLERELLLADGALHRYQVFVPSRRAGGERPALILFLHGSGERGDDNRRQLEVGLGPVIRARMDSFPAIAVFPQMHADRDDPGHYAFTALAILDHAQAEFAADPQRIALTGLSMGGFLSYELALMRPERFAAVAPICGGFDPPHGWNPRRIAALGGVTTLDEAARRLASTPLWIFHGARDDIVRPERSREMIEALHRAGASARYTEFADADHNAWDPAYAMPEFWDWLWLQRRD